MTYKAFWLEILLICLILLPNTLPPLNIGGFVFEWQLGDLLISATGIYLLLKILLSNGKMRFVLGITRLDRLVSILLLAIIFSSIVASLRFSNHIVFIFGSLIKSVEPHILYFFLRSSIYKENDIRCILRAIILITIIICLIGIIQIISPDFYLKIINIFFSKSRILHDESFMVGIRWRVSSLFINPNKLANFILLMFPFVFIRLNLKLNLINKIFHIILIIILLILLIFTQSREGWLGFIFMFIYVLNMAVINKRSPNIKKNTLVIFILVILLAALNYPLIYHRMIEYTFGGQGFEYLYEASSSRARFILWKASLVAITKNWLIGCGPMGGKVVQEFVPFNFITGGDPHNTFLRTFLETGIIGFIALLLIIKELLNFGKHSLMGYFNIYKYSIVASTIGLIVSGLFGDSFHDFEVITIFFILVALLENIRAK